MNKDGNNGDFSAETVPAKFADHSMGGDGYVYFARGDGSIKIGFSTQPRARLKQLQGATGAKLTLLLAVPTSIITERAAHLKFHHLRTHGEWFRAEPELLAFVAELRERAFGPKRVRDKTGLAKALRRKLSTLPEAKRSIAMNIIEILEPRGMFNPSMKEVLLRRQLASLGAF